MALPSSIAVSTTNLKLAEIFHQYLQGQNDDSWVYYLKIKKGREKIVKCTPDQEAPIPGYNINWNKRTTRKSSSVLLLVILMFNVELSFVHYCLVLFTNWNRLKTDYTYANQNALHAMLRYHHRD